MNEPEREAAVVAAEMARWVAIVVGGAFFFVGAVLGWALDQPWVFGAVLAIGVVVSVAVWVWMGKIERRRRFRRDAPPSG